MFHLNSWDLSSTTAFGRMAIRVRGSVVESEPFLVTPSHSIIRWQRKYYYDYFLTLPDEVLPTPRSPHNPLTYRIGQIRLDGEKDVE